MTHTGRARWRSIIGTSGPFLLDFLSLRGIVVRPNLFVTSLVPVLLSVSLLVAAHTPAARLHYTDTELVDFIPIHPQLLRKNFQVLYSIGPLSIEAGKLVDFRLQAELTNNCGNPVGLGRYIIRAGSANALTGVIVNKAVMSNITKDEHHEVVVHSGFDHLRTSVDGVFYNVIVYAVSSKPMCNGVEPEGNNKLSVEGLSNRGFGAFVLEVR